MSIEECLSPGFADSPDSPQCATALKETGLWDLGAE